MEAAFFFFGTGIDPAVSVPFGRDRRSRLPAQLPRKGCRSPLEKRGEIWYNGRIGGTESAAGGKDGTHT